MKSIIIQDIKKGGELGAKKLWVLPDETYNKIMEIMNEEPSIAEAGEEIYDEPKFSIKSFKEVQIGDMAHHDSCNSKLGIPDGPIVWKGDSEKLKREKPEELPELIDEQNTTEEQFNAFLEDYNQWVIVDLPIYGHTLYNYNIDSSGAKVFK